MKPSEPIEVVKCTTPNEEAPVAGKNTNQPIFFFLWMVACLFYLVVLVSSVLLLISRLSEPIDFSALAFVLGLGGLSILVLSVLGPMLYKAMKDSCHH